MFSKARAHPQSRARRRLHFSLPWKLNLSSHGLLFLIQNKGQTESMWLCFIYGEMQPSGFPKASANSARRCLKPSERHCALPFQRHPSSGAGLVVLGAAGGEHQPAQHDTGSMIL